MAANITLRYSSVELLSFFPSARFAVEKQLIAIVFLQVLCLSFPQFCARWLPCEEARDTSFFFHVYFPATSLSSAKQHCSTHWNVLSGITMTAQPRMCRNCCVCSDCVIASMFPCPPPGLFCSLRVSSHHSSIWVKNISLNLCVAEMFYLDEDIEEILVLSHR